MPKPLKDKLNKSSLVSHLVTETELDPKTVKTVLAQLESTMIGALNKKGAGEFTLPGLLPGKYVLRVRAADLSLAHFATEPVTVEQLAREAFGIAFRNDPGTPPAQYDARTRYDALFGGARGYLLSRQEVLDRMRRFVAAEREELARGSADAPGTRPRRAA